MVIIHKNQSKKKKKQKKIQKTQKHNPDLVKETLDQSLVGQEVKVNNNRQSDVIVGKSQKYINEQIKTKYPVQKEEQDIEPSQKQQQSTYGQGDGSEKQNKSIREYFQSFFQHCKKLTQNYLCCFCKKRKNQQEYEPSSPDLDKETLALDQNQESQQVFNTQLPSAEEQPKKSQQQSSNDQIDYFQKEKNENTQELKKKETEQDIKNQISLKLQEIQINKQLNLSYPQVSQEQQQMSISQQISNESPSQTKQQHQQSSQQQQTNAEIDYSQKDINKQIAKNDKSLNSNNSDVFPSPEKLNNQKNNEENYFPNSIQNYGNTCYFNSTIQLIKLVYFLNEQFKQIIHQNRMTNQFCQSLYLLFTNRHVISKEQIQRIFRYLENPYFQLNGKPNDCRNLINSIISKIKSIDRQTNLIFKSKFLFFYDNCCCGYLNEDTISFNPIVVQIADIDQSIEKCFNKSIPQAHCQACGESLVCQVKINTAPQILLFSVDQDTRQKIKINNTLSFNSDSETNQTLSYELIAAIFGPGHNYIQIKHNQNYYELNDHTILGLDNIEEYGNVQLLCYQRIIT